MVVVFNIILSTRKPNGTIIVTKITEKWYYTQALHA